MISHIKTMIPGFGRTGFGRDQIYPNDSRDVKNGDLYSLNKSDAKTPLFI